MNDAIKAHMAGMAVVFKTARGGGAVAFETAPKSYVSTLDLIPLSGLGLANECNEMCYQHTHSEYPS